MLSKRACVDRKKILQIFSIYLLALAAAVACGHSMKTDVSISANTANDSQLNANPN